MHSAGQASWHLSLVTSCLCSWDLLRLKFAAGFAEDFRQAGVVDRLEDLLKAFDNNPAVGAALDAFLD